MCVCASRHSGGSKKGERAKRNPKPRPTSSRFANSFLALPYTPPSSDPLLDPHPIQQPSTPHPHQEWQTRPSPPTLPQLRFDGY